MSRKIAGSLHAHGCKRCHVRYQDACTEPVVDELCVACRGFRAWQLLIDNAAPHPCCFLNSRLVNKHEKDIYRLAGTHLWHICLICARTHPTKPTETP